MRTKIVLVLVALCMAAGMAVQGGEVIKDGLVDSDKVAEKQFKQALKKEQKDKEYSLQVYERLANGGYAPAQYKLYELGKGEEWREKAALGGVSEAITPVLESYIKQYNDVINHGRKCLVNVKKGVVDTKEITAFEKELRDAHLFMTKNIITMKENMHVFAPKDIYYLPGYKKLSKEKLRDLFAKQMAIMDAYFDEIEKQTDNCYNILAEIQKRTKK